MEHDHHLKNEESIPERSSHPHAFHDHHAMIGDFKKRCCVVLILTIPIMLRAVVQAIE
jgi:hypothetical protein